MAWPLMAALAAGALLALPGCSGCAPMQGEQASDEKDGDDEDEDKEKERPKPDFEFAYKQDDRLVRMRVLPGDMSNGVKPGHWMSLSQPLKANNFDFTGELISAAVDNNRRPLRLERTPYRMQMSRPVALPKGQLKHLEMNVFLPRRETPSGSRANLLAELRARGAGRTVMEHVDPTTTMDPHQYYLVALARRPASYNYLKVLDSVRAPAVGDFISSPLLHYRVVLPATEQNVPLPSNPLLWTSIAYVIWDDIDPDKLTLEQQNALVDWLHWGGSLIISGPGSLATLKNSFLADYLPALAGDTEKLAQDRFEELNTHFTLAGASGKLAPLQVAADKPPEGVRLRLREGASYVPKTGELLAERQVGAGRVVVASFSLTHPQILKWANFDGFFNACLLRRPARRFYGNEDVQAVGVRFVGESIEHRDQSVDVEKDPRLTCGLRYFTRDSGVLQSPQPGELADRPVLYDRGFRKTPQSGVAGWNDLSGASRAARDSLKAAAGITVPPRGFVLRVLAVYLLVLVPVNWAFFKALGRVEWAWAAAPIIAVAGAFWVIHAAQLDIGFARSRTEIGVLELQGDHPRGHLTRYVALYTSLSTRYDVNFDDKNALALPFSTDPDFEMVTGQTADTVEYHRGSGARLRGFQVASNSTSMLHSEEQRSFGGPIALRQEPHGWVVANQSALALKDVGVLYRLPNAPRRENGVRVAWIGDLPPGVNVPLKFGPVADDRALLPQWEESPATRSNPPPNELSLARLLDLARDPGRLLPGDVKLIGWTDEELGGMELDPAPRQKLARTLVIANLQYQELSPPTPDINTHDAVDPKKNGGVAALSGDEPIAARFVAEP